MFQQPTKTGVTSRLDLTQTCSEAQTWASSKGVSMSVVKNALQAKKSMRLSTCYFVRHVQAYVQFGSSVEENLYSICQAENRCQA